MVKLGILVFFSVSVLDILSVFEKFNSDRKSKEQIVRLNWSRIRWPMTTLPFILLFPPLQAAVQAEQLAHQLLQLQGANREATDRAQGQIRGS